MAKRKKTIIIMISFATIVLLLGGTMAVFVAATPVKEEVSTTKLGIELVQTSDNQQSSAKSISSADGKIEGFQYIGLPGDTVEEKIAVQNSENKDCYVRVTVNRSWIDENSKKIFEEQGAALYPEDIEITTMSSNWLVTTDPEDAEVMYCYYTKPLKAGTTTDNVMDSFSILKNKIEENSNRYSKLATEITFQADAIQTTAAKDAMLAEWGVVTEIDADGNITSYTEQ